MNTRSRSTVFPCPLARIPVLALFLSLALLAGLPARAPADPASAEPAASPAETTSTAGPAATEPAHLRFESARGPILLGEVTRRDILMLDSAWTEPYNEYEPDRESLARLRTIEAPVEVICVLGTWCSDSAREVPRFWKILDALDNPYFSFRMDAVGRANDEEAARALRELGYPDLRTEYDVELVPTFVFQQYGKEVGRIVETPETSLEEDAVRILFGEAADEPAVQWR
jgi:thiol-disulfide isomerase/thioredoxin